MTLPKIGDTIKTGTLEEIKAIEGVIPHHKYDLVMNLNGVNTGLIYEDEFNLLGKEYPLSETFDPSDQYLMLNIGDEDFAYPKWAYEALLSKQPKKVKQPKQTKLEAEKTTLEARLSDVNEGIKLEADIKSLGSDLKTKRARLAEIKKNGGV